MTTTISKSIFAIIIGIAVSAIIVSKLSTGPATAPATDLSPTDKPATGTKFNKLVYAGMPDTYRYRGELLNNGWLKPIGGPAGINELYDGDPNSDYCMVYEDIFSAYNSATKNNTCSGTLAINQAGNLKSQSAPASSLRGGDVYKEQPVFLKGMTSGWVCFKVRPFMGRQEILNLK